MVVPWAMSDAPVRLATAADLAAIARMGADLARRHEGYDPLRFHVPDGFEAGYGEWFAQELPQVPDAVYLGVVDGPTGLAGYVYGRLEGRDWDRLLEPHASLVDVYVEAGARGQGLGARLVRAFCAWADERAARVVLSSATANEGAQRLFVALGFRPTMVELTRERPQ